MSETWEPVADFPKYDVSDHGRVRSWHFRKPRVLKPAPLPSGHLHVDLVEGQTRKTMYIHRLVLEAFVGPCPDGMECRHLHGDPSNNHVGNLAWGTRSQNRYDSVRHGTHASAGRGSPGEENGMSKLINADVLEMRRLYRTGEYTMIELAGRFGTTRPNVSRIIHRQGWTHI